MRLIDADALQNLFNEATTLLMKRISIKGIDHFARACFMTTEMIHDAPTIEAEPVRHGHWYTVDYNHWFCSECGWDDSGFLEEKPNYKYCPNCGAKME